MRQTLEQRRQHHQTRADRQIAAYNKLLGEIKELIGKKATYGLNSHAESRLRAKLFDAARLKAGVIVGD